MSSAYASTASAALAAILNASKRTLFLYGGGTASRVEIGRGARVKLKFANSVVEIIVKHIIKSLALAVERAARSGIVAERIEEQLVVFLEI